LEEQDAAACAGLAFGDKHDVRGSDEIRVLRAVLKAGEVSIVLIRPTCEFAHERRDLSEAFDDDGADVEDVVICRAGDPDENVSLRRGHCVTVWAAKIVIEALRIRGCIAGYDGAP
jgi:hypothetical protein